MCIQSNTTVFFSPLVATVFGHYDHHQANAIQSLIFFKLSVRLNTYIFCYCILVSRAVPPHILNLGVRWR